MSPARATWRLHKARILIEIQVDGTAWVDDHLFEIQLQILEGVPFCRIVSGAETMVQGALA